MSVPPCPQCGNGSRFTRAANYIYCNVCGNHYGPMTDRFPSTEIVTVAAPPMASAQPVVVLPPTTLPMKRSASSAAVAVLASTVIVIGAFLVLLFLAGAMVFVAIFCVIVFPLILVLPMLMVGFVGAITATAAAFGGALAAVWVRR